MKLITSQIKLGFNRTNVFKINLSLYERTCNEDEIRMTK
jgi:hypothetical protein